MAQAGYTPIQLYYSSTTTNVPLAASLANGELAINITDGKLFYKDNSAAVQVIGWKTVPATAGGTGQTSYAVGDLIYANTTTTLAKLADVATGNALISGGVGVAPSYGKIGLTTHVSGTLPIANGGTNASSASITAFNNITGYSASGATGTTTTNLVFSTSPTLTTPIATTTIGVGSATPSASGAGITFPATQSASTNANTLDDYEEGTWTPIIAVGITTPSYTVNNARYVKIGVLVYINLYIQFNSVQTRNSSDLEISGLPFTVTAPTSGNSGGVTITNCNASFNSSATQPLPVLLTGTTSIYFYKVNGSTFLGTDISAGNFNITIAGCYYSA